MDAAGAPTRAPTVSADAKLSPILRRGAPATAFEPNESASWMLRTAGRWRCVWQKGTAEERVTETRFSCRAPTRDGIDVASPSCPKPARSVVMAARPSWEGFLTFNLISIPVKAYNAIGPGGKIGFHLLHAKCNQRIRYKKVCPIHGEVSNDEIVSGYEFAKGKYVPVRREERAGLRAAEDKTIAIDAFVAPDAIDPTYFSGRTFYLVPATAAAQKPFAVLTDAMRGLARHAVAWVVLSG